MVGPAQTFVILEFARRAARVVARQVIPGRATQAGGNQQGIGEDIQHDLSPFPAWVMPVAMLLGVIRFTKAFKL
jgi:hypothetical protein